MGKTWLNNKKKEAFPIDAITIALNKCSLYLSKSIINKRLEIPIIGTRKQTGIKPEEKAIKLGMKAKGRVFFAPVKKTEAVTVRILVA